MQLVNISVSEEPGKWKICLKCSWASIKAFMSGLPKSQCINFFISVACGFHHVGVSSSNALYTSGLSRKKPGFIKTDGKTAPKFLCPREVHFSERQRSHKLSPLLETDNTVYWDNYLGRTETRFVSLALPLPKWSSASLLTYPGIDFSHL